MRFDAGTRFGPYILESLLGPGGMGEVYRARDTRLDRIVAIKVIPPELAYKPHVRARFQREARSISAPQPPPHLYVVRCRRTGRQEFLVMEYLEGETLAPGWTGARWRSRTPCMR